MKSIRYRIKNLIILKVFRCLRKLFVFSYNTTLLLFLFLQIYIENESKKNFSYIYHSFEGWNYVLRVIKLLSYLLRRALFLFSRVCCIIHYSDLLLRTWKHRSPLKKILVFFHYKDGNYRRKLNFEYRFKMRLPHSSSGQKYGNF